MRIAAVLRLVEAGIKIASMLMSYQGRLGDAAKAQLKKMKALYRRENLRDSARLEDDIEAELKKRKRQ